MLKITAPHNNLEERNYIISIIFKDFLGLDFQTEFSDQYCAYNIILTNNNKLVIKDHFFNNFKQSLDYLKYNNIPTVIKWAGNSFTANRHIPVIYGTDVLQKSKDKILCGIDIFACCFFMLTRWEEYVNKNRDDHNRFPATASTAFKQGFLDRPVVNEYIQMLKKMLLFLDDTLNFNKLRQRLYLTHDIDQLKFWRSYRQFIRIVGGDLLKRKSPATAIKNSYSFIGSKLGLVSDPYNTFDYLMRISEKAGLQSRFYFMSGGTSPDKDNRYRIDHSLSLQLIQKIKKRGHLFGLHGSYNSYTDPEQLKYEKNKLESLLQQEITAGRQHYLRFTVPATWQTANEAGLKLDSTCGYADKPGFRCGTGREFFVFNILTRKKLNLKEKPLIVMDCSLFEYNTAANRETTDYLTRLYQRADALVFLWHNSYIKKMNLYEKIIKKYTDEKNNFNSIE
ncbi:MAG TPA: polysaccharide deacetylase family protein [Spirochaetota bacterium]|nr:polysaccharide deacetylase family protein [Spirochaetota bacterium]